MSIGKSREFIQLKNLIRQPLCLYFIIYLKGTTAILCGEFSVLLWRCMYVLFPCFNNVIIFNYIYFSIISIPTSAVRGSTCPNCSAAWLCFKCFFCFKTNDRCELSYYWFLSLVFTFVYKNLSCHIFMKIIY